MNLASVVANRNVPRITHWDLRLACAAEGNVAALPCDTLRRTAQSAHLASTFGTAVLAEGLTLYADLHGKNAAIDWVAAYWEMCELTPSSMRVCRLWLFTRILIEAGICVRVAALWLQPSAYCHTNQPWRASWLVCSIRLYGWHGHLHCNLQICIVLPQPLMSNGVDTCRYNYEHEVIVGAVSELPRSGISFSF